MKLSNIASVLLIGALLLFLAPSLPTASADGGMPEINDAPAAIEAAQSSGYTLNVTSAGEYDVPGVWDYFYATNSTPELAVANAYSYVESDPLGSGPMWIGYTAPGKAKTTFTVTETLYNKMLSEANGAVLFIQFNEVAPYAGYTLNVTAAGEYNVQPGWTYFYATNSTPELAVANAYSYVESDPLGSGPMWIGYTAPGKAKTTFTVTETLYNKMLSEANGAVLFIQFK